MANFPGYLNGSKAGNDGVETYLIVEGDEYVYTHNAPAGHKGGRYCVKKVEVLDVPSYQQKVLVECVAGRDKGLWFTVSPANFALRYVPVKPPARDKVAGRGSLD